MSSITPLEILRIDGPVVPGSYIIKLKDDVDKSNHLTWAESRLCTQSQLITPSREWDSATFHGYAGEFSEETLNALRTSPDVEYIEENPILEECGKTTQTDAPWGLQRISQDAKLKVQDDTKLNFSYIYNTKAGQGTDVYIVDGGIFLEHEDFGGRAKWGATYAGSDKKDVRGHGTHCAGIAGGTQYGVAKKSTLIAVKVVRDDGKTSGDALVSGFNYIKKEAASTKRPSVASVSLAGAKSQALNDVVKTLTDAGIHFVTGAGNDDKDASTVSPASAPSANTVGNTTIADTRRYSSNYGSVVKLWAPGTNIISCGITSKTSTESYSGTSQACPHVAGLIAYLISIYGNMSPAMMSAKLQVLGVKNAISGLSADTPNVLSRNDEIR